MSDRLERYLDAIDEFQDQSKGLLAALFPFRSRLAEVAENVRRGVVLGGMPSILEGLRDESEVLDQLLPVADLNFGEMMRDELLTTSLLVYQTWTSLVYMRSDRILEVLRGLRHQSKHLSAFLKLLKSDDLRRLRNALAHGSFEAEYGMLKWYDDRGGGRIEYKLLRRLNSAIYCLWLNIFAISGLPEAITLDELLLDDPAEAAGRIFAIGKRCTSEAQSACEDPVVGSPEPVTAAAEPGGCSRTRGARR